MISRSDWEPLPKPTLSPFARGYLSLCRFFTAAVWCVPALRVPLVHSLINHFRQKFEPFHKTVKVSILDMCLHSSPIYLWLSLSVSLCKMRAHDRAVQHPAQPRLVACLGLISRLQLLLQLPHQHIRSFWTTCIALASNEVAGRSELERHVSRGVVDHKMVKKWHVIEFLFHRMVKVCSLR